MHVFVTGGTGQVGHAVVNELIAAGHEVTGLARSDAAADRYAELGAKSRRGTIEDLDVLRGSARDADGVIHMSTSGAFSDPAALTRREVEAIQAFGEGLAGSGKPLLTTSGTLVLRAGETATEDDEPDADAIASLRIPGEEMCRNFAEQDVRSVVIRPAPTVHGPEDHGFVPMLVATARRTGLSAFIGDGTNRWPAVHRLDLAKLYRLALESGTAGSTYHGVGESAIAFREIAEAIGKGAKVPAGSVSADDAGAHFDSPFMARIFAADAPASSDLTRSRLGWTPTHPTLLEDLETGDYFHAVEPRQET